MPDFEGLAAHLLSRIRDIIPVLLPGGKLVGAEYECASINGGNGKSFRININTGLWADFAAGHQGGDIISLYAAIHNIKQSEAADRLAKEYGYTTPVANEPSMYHPKNGKPSASWCYRDARGNPLFYVARYDTADGKEFCPWRLIDGRWTAKGPDEPRPLYGLDKLTRDRVLIVEGEKSCDAARQLLGQHYDVVTWSGGSMAYKKTDWTPVYGKTVLIWPDADQPGVKAASGIAEFLTVRSPQVKVITVSDKPKGWDAADALADGMTTADVIAWAKPRATVYATPEPVVELLPKPEPTPAITVTINPPVEADNGMPTDSLHATWDRLGLVMSTAGYPICNEDNVCRVFEGEKMLGDKIWFDEFYNSVFIERHGGPHAIEEIDVYKLTLDLQRKYGMRRISDSTIWRSLLILADRVRKNEPKDWMESLVWDGRPRIENFMMTHLGAAESEYTRSASKNFWISIVARIYSPGCIMRTMVILKSPQWTGKSTAFSIIGGKWYAEALESIQSNNFLQSLHGKMLIEFADMSGMDRAEVNRIKQIISCRMDRFRAPYDRTPKDHLRQCVLVSTTNEGHFLRDDTGGSRFWPIETGEIRHDLLTADRDQLFAEAVHAFKAGATYHIMPMQETEEIQEKYRQSDEWEDAIKDWIINSPYKPEFSVREVACEGLKISIDRLDKSAQIRIARNLTRIGCERIQKFTDGKNIRLWRRGDRFL